jgi:hypothetical protein
MARTAQWSVLTYIAAHNNLEMLGRRSRGEILNVGSSPDVVHGMLYDGRVGGARYVVGEAGTVDSQDTLGAFNSGDPDALIATANWFFTQHEAERYALILWSHGTGWEPAEIAAVAGEARPNAKALAADAPERARQRGSQALFRTTFRRMLTPDAASERAILFDDGTGQSVDTMELGRVAGAITAAIGRPLELLGMDACLMANLEVAYQLRHDVKYCAASSELVPGHSWPYDAIFGELRAHPDMNGADLARLIVDRYVRAYTAAPPQAGDVTKVALDLGRVRDVAAATDRLAAALQADMARHADVLWDVQLKTRQHEAGSRKRSPSKFDYHLWDLGSVSAALSAAADASADVHAAAAAVNAALEPGKGAVLAEGHVGAWFDGTCGVSIYLPLAQRLTPAYAGLAFAADTQWDEMVTAYRELVV